MKAFKFFWASCVTLGLMAGFSTRSSADKPYFEIDNRSGCDIPGGWIEFQPDNPPDTLWLQYPGIPNGQSALLLSPAPYATGQVINQSPAKVPLCSGRISNPLIVYAVTFNALKGSCPASLKSTSLPCTISEMHSPPTTALMMVPVQENDVGDSINLVLESDQHARGKRKEASSKTSTSAAEKELTGEVPPPFAPESTESSKNSLGDFTLTTLPRAGAPVRFVVADPNAATQVSPLAAAVPLATDTPLTADLHTVTLSSAPADETEPSRPLFAEY